MARYSFNASGSPVPLRGEAYICSKSVGISCDRKMHDHRTGFEIASDDLGVHSARPPPR